MLILWQKPEPLLPFCLSYSQSWQLWVTAANIFPSPKFDSFKVRPPGPLVGPGP